MTAEDAGLIYPEADDVLDIMAKYGIAAQLRDRAGLESACAAPRASAWGVDVHEDVAAKVAALAWSVCTLHPFVDGNKRCTAIMLVHFCLTNGWDPQFSQGELVAVALEMARGQLHRDELTEWLRQRFNG
ncbi:type II toxin-antitoxin system death-on-curing family toxin [Actinokineospora sp. NPDC004072]